jgi:hypothetical protein
LTKPEQLDSAPTHKMRAVARQQRATHDDFILDFRAATGQAPADSMKADSMGPAPIRIANASPAANFG